ncbi:hypothetical protein MMC18_008270 [Xylographa bjoerkii]|nr:hypothetical protein [Xylographa bjoerkii]
MPEGSFDRLTPWAKSKLTNYWKQGPSREYEPNNRKDKSWILSVPTYDEIPRMEFQYRGKNEKLKLAAGDLKSIFSTVVPGIVRLVQRQVEAIIESTGTSPQVILLVGGFGENRFLLAELKRAFSDIQILRPKDACVE